jgi:hypothetical protein
VTSNRHLKSARTEWFTAEAQRTQSEENRVFRLFLSAISAVNRHFREAREARVAFEDLVRKRYCHHASAGHTMRGS